MVKRAKTKYVLLLLVVGVFILGMLTRAQAAETPLHNETAGTVITFSGRQWVILEQMPNGETYILLNDKDCERAFDPDNTNLYNPSDSNNIAYYLNNTFYNSLSQKELIADHSWDRVAVDGNGNNSTDYGSVTCKVGLLSYREYEEYSTYYNGNILPSSYSYYWWTRTPQTQTEYPEHVWSVHVLGVLNCHDASVTTWSVRPALYLKAGLVVDENKVVVGESVNSPAPPTQLSASAESSNTVNLTWQANTEEDLAGYRLYRNGILIADISKPQTTYSDNTVLPGTTYTYEITAYNTAGQESARSSPVTVTTPEEVIPASMIAVWEENRIKVTWSVGDSPPPGEPLELWRQMENGPWLPVKSITENERAGFVFYDADVAVGLNCRYELRQQGGMTNFFEWQTLAESDWATGDRPLFAPGGLSLINLTENSATVGWNAVNGASSYTVQYSTDGGMTWQTQAVFTTNAVVPRESKVRIRAGGVHSHWSGVITVS